MRPRAALGRLVGIGLLAWCGATGVFAANAATETIRILDSVAAPAHRIVVNENFGQLSIYPDAELLRESAAGNDALDFAQIRSWHSLPWQPVTSSTVNAGYSDDTLWLRFSLRRDDTGPGEVQLEVANPLLDELDIFLATAGRPPVVFRLGDTRPPQNRPYSWPGFLVPVELPVDTDVDVYVRARTHGLFELPVALRDMPGFVAQAQRGTLRLAAIYGAILCTVIVFMIVALSTHERSFSWALIFLFSLAVFQAHNDGLIGQYFPLDGHWWNENNNPLIVLFINAIAARFTTTFLDLPEKLPPAHKATSVLVILFALVLPPALLVFGHRLFPFLTVTVLVVAFASVLFGLYSISRGIPRARAYTLIMLLYAVSVATAGAVRLGLLTTSVDLHGIMLGCLALQALVLGFVLASRIRRDMMLRTLAEDRAQAARKRALAAEWHVTYELEREVERQTGALSQTMQELRNVNHKLAEMSRHDGLTGLNNRRHFNERYPEIVQLAARQQQPLAILMLDVDHFKSFNDTHGHVAGDECLRQVAATLRRVIARNTDFLARYGGEEFVAMLPDTGLEEASAIAERTRAAIEAMEIETEDLHLKVTVSIGLAGRIPAAMEADRLLADADAALYRAKERGRNRVEL